MPTEQDQYRVGVCKYAPGGQHFAPRKSICQYCEEDVRGLFAASLPTQTRPAQTCPSTIEVSGKILTCELFNGPTHNPEHSYLHRAELQESATEWRIVEWGFKRLVMPPRVG